MSNQAHIFHPKNASFGERIRSYKDVLEAYRNLQASFEYSDDKNWADRLGTAEELSHAEVVIKNSLKAATDFIMPSEIVEAIGKGLLTSDDAELIERIERQHEMQSLRSDKNTINNRNNFSI